MTRITLLMAMVPFVLITILSCGGGGGGGNSSDDGSSGGGGLIVAANCPDNDGDGYLDVICGGADCNDSDPNINPLIREICADNIDQNCDGSDKTCSDGGAAAHSSLNWDGSPGICLTCHLDQAEDVYASTHYQWQGETPYMTHGPQLQGKIAGAVNSYCINILGNWSTCGNCHVGLGVQPQATDFPSQAQLENIDCLICHQIEYRRKKVAGIFVPDAANMAITLNEAVQTVHRPTRANCLQCHAKAGGGDAVKRGDLALASAATADLRYDIHMAVSGGNLNCQDCHAVRQHRFAGKGSDIRPTDLDIQIACSACHTHKATGRGHSSSAVNRHVARVACQTCHIPYYSKDADDSTASEATETHRTWLSTSSAAAPFHPDSTRARNLVPKYRFWNRYSENYLLGDIARLDSATGAYPTSRPEGFVDDESPASKLYPFKYKTAEQPILDATGQLIALDTNVYFATGDPDSATSAGLVNMGYSGNEAYNWIITDTFQLLNHQISPESEALSCSDCHGNSARMDLKGELGYHLKASQSQVCSQCHGKEERKDFKDLHEEHVEEERYDCSHCHTFSRPERNLR
ncbi:MAG: MopE-related protein [Desulfobacterales bacterium]|nr:MopE-related protein [Desulfobacterales bacterium]